MLAGRMKSTRTTRTTTRTAGIVAITAAYHRAAVTRWLRSFHCLAERTNGNEAANKKDFKVIRTKEWLPKEWLPNQFV